MFASFNYRSPVICCFSRRETKNISSPLPKVSSSGAKQKGFTMPSKNKAQQEVTGDPSQDTPKHAKQLNGEMLYTYLALCKRELDTNALARLMIEVNCCGSDTSSWSKLDLHILEFWLSLCTSFGGSSLGCPTLHLRINVLNSLLRSQFWGRDNTFHLPPEEWDALIKINENISTFRKGGLLHDDLMEGIFANRVATGRYAIGPARDDFIDTATSNVAADLNMEDENNVPTEQADFIEDTNTYFIDHHFEPSQAEHSTPQTEQYTPYHFA
ncbi:hypothetical protein GIB67_029856 [Kingdonia uniflora]|uniref:Uncharacterized protein n=1 Tax=Kingdonia uniflora TaxID=39325 RepID=A0A7J7NJY7_9MAGN|nr:hypothetical protein GIB67_029856 [Kingdonia uniflora]